MEQEVCSLATLEALEIFNVHTLHASTVPLSVEFCSATREMLNWNFPCVEMCIINYFN